LDSVEYNIEVVGREMKGAVEELEQATTYQKNTGRRKCIFLLMLICVGLVVSWPPSLFLLLIFIVELTLPPSRCPVQIVLIYKPRSHSSSPSTPPPTPPIPIPTSIKVAGRCKIAMPRFEVVEDLQEDPWARSRAREETKMERARRRRGGEKGRLAP